MSTDESKIRAALTTNTLGKDKPAPILDEPAKNLGSLPNSTSKPGGQVPAEDLKRAELADHILRLTANDVDIATLLLAKVPAAKSIRDVVLGVGLEDLNSLTKASEDGKANSNKASGQSHGTVLRQTFFKVEPTAVIHRMVLDNEIESPDSATRDSLAKFFSNQPDFNIREKSVLAAIQHPEAFTGIPVEKQGNISSRLKALQTVQALSSRPEAIPILMKANIRSAFQVSSIPEASFVKAFASTLGTEHAKQIHQHALKSRARADHALVTMLQTLRGSGIAAIDGNSTLETRKRALTKKLHGAIFGQKAAPNPPPVIDLESLFGSLDVSFDFLPIFYQSAGSWVRSRPPKTSLCLDNKLALRFSALNSPKLHCVLCNANLLSSIANVSQTRKFDADQCPCMSDFVAMMSTHRGVY